MKSCIKFLVPSSMVSLVSTNTQERTYCFRLYKPMCGHPNVGLQCTRQYLTTAYTLLPRNCTGSGQCNLHCIRTIWTHKNDRRHHGGSVSHLCRSLPQILRKQMSRNTCAEGESSLLTFPPIRLSLWNLWVPSSIVLSKLDVAMK